MGRGIRAGGARSESTGQLNQEKGDRKETEEEEKQKKKALLEHMDQATLTL